MKPKTENETNPIELKVGSAYRAKSPRRVCWGFSQLVNDRVLIWVGAGQVQYDSPTVKNGMRHPVIDKDKFLKWVGEEIPIESLPKGDWMPWDEYKRTKTEKK